MVLQLGAEEQNDVVSLVVFFSQVIAYNGAADCFQLKHLSGINVCFIVSGSRWQTETCDSFCIGHIDSFEHPFCVSSDRIWLTG